jgi:peptidoglycan/LPS O-acetylase OafA/YrhL
MLLALTVLNWHYRVTPFNFIFSFSAVFIFMMISGFYMAMVIDQKYGTTPLGIITFYGARLVRLLPAYWVVLGLCYLFALNPGAPARSIWEILNDVFIVPRAFWETITGTVGGGGGLYLGQMYTVALEMMFYAMAPLLCCGSGRSSFCLFFRRLIPALHGGTNCRETRGNTSFSRRPCPIFLAAFSHTGFI